MLLSLEVTQRSNKINLLIKSTSWMWCNAVSKKWRHFQWYKENYWLWERIPVVQWFACGSCLKAKRKAIFLYDIFLVVQVIFCEVCLSVLENFSYLLLVESSASPWNLDFRVFPKSLRYGESNGVLQFFSSLLFMKKYNLQISPNFAICNIERFFGHCLDSSIKLTSRATTKCCIKIITVAVTLLLDHIGMYFADQLER